MLKSVTISPYKENSPAGEKARWIAMSLEQYDRIHNTNSSIYQEDGDYGQFESTQMKTPDFCIQYVKPLDFVKTPYKNIGIFEPTLKGVPYEKNVINLLDNVLVYSEAQKKALPEIIRNKCSVIRPTMVPLAGQPEMKKVFSKFLFYTSAIEEHTNIDMVILAYLSSFTINDNVKLYVLCDNTEELLHFINKSKESLGLYKKVPLYPEIELRTDPSAHGSCHCFIDASMDYNISIHTMLAVASCNPIVTSGSDGLFEWVDKESCYSIDSHEGSRNSYLIGSVPDYLSLKESLLEAFNNRKSFGEKQDKMIKDCHKSFYDKKEGSIGDVLCSLS